MVVRESPRHAESVDPDGKPSLPWRDDTTAAHCRGSPVLRSKHPGLRGRGKEACAGTRCGTGSRATGSEREAGCSGTCAPADIKSGAQALRLAVASGFLRVVLTDQDSPVIIHFLA